MKNKYCFLFNLFWYISDTAYLVEVEQSNSSLTVSQTNRQTIRKTYIHTDRKTGRKRKRQIDRQIDGQTPDTLTD